jgi:exopolyphosphatase/guanosine-5'-triphosphate,3'-diphosphate pyrophosphatase
MPAISLFRAKAAADRPIGIIDIGSNSIRLVVYDGASRIPSILFNEKVMAGLGKGLAKTGALDEATAARALTALIRFRRLAQDMGVIDLRIVATAAVRDASNGHSFLASLAVNGLSVELLSGHEEASLAGHGVLAAFPDADGIVGDLGGGSLELVRIARGDVGEGASVPFGVLRMATMKRDARALGRALGKALDAAGWQGDGRGKPLYLVGGSWRSLARLDMAMTGYPLPIVHNYVMPPDRAQGLVRSLAQIDVKRLRSVAGISGSRAPTLGAAAMLLSLLAKRLQPSTLVVSAYGLREGLLHRTLPEHVQIQDPLIEATRAEGARQGRFAEHGDLLDRWIASLFADEPPQLARLRHAACLLADVGWRAHPEFRAERGLETALHGNWVGIDGPGRAMVALALYTHFGGNGVPEIILSLIDSVAVATAIRWGLAIRLGQRLSGGVAGPLESSDLTLQDGTLVLTLSGEDGVLYGEAIERRHKMLAEALGRRPVTRVRPKG